jgi:putative intracellular protease/amidase
LARPDYIAPEQAVDASSADIRADIYSLGCTFYYLLTGGPPFPGGSALDKLQAHRKAQPEPLANRRPDTPPEIVALVEQMLAKDPSRRFQTPVELAQALAAIQKAAKVSESEVQAPLGISLSTAPKAPAGSLSHAGSGSRPPSRVVRRAILLGGAAAVLVAGLWLALGGNDDQPPQPALAPPTKSPKRVLFVIPSTGVWYPDYGPVKNALEADGVQVRTAALIKGRCELLPNPEVAKTAPPVIADLAITDSALRASDYDALIFGGFQINPFIDEASPAHSAVAKLLRESRQQGRIVTAICVGQAVLAQHHILDGLPAAGGGFLHKNFPYDVPGGPSWNDRPVQIAAGGRIITGRDHDAAPAFAAELLRQLSAPAP